MFKFISYEGAYAIFTVHGDAVNTIYAKMASGELPLDTILNRLSSTLDVKLRNAHNYSLFTYDCYYNLFIINGNIELTFEPDDYVASWYRMNQKSFINTDDKNLSDNIELISNEYQSEYESEYSFHAHTSDYADTEEELDLIERQLDKNDYEESEEDEVIGWGFEDMDEPINEAIEDDKDF